jgi:hypothetical protein
MPEDTEGKPIDKFADIRQIGNPLDRLKEATATKEPPPANPELMRAQWQDGAMPAWMRMQLQQAQDERGEARRRQEEGDIRREEWERGQSQREYDRQERLDNQEKARLEQQQARDYEGAQRAERQERARTERDAHERQEKMERDERNQIGRDGRERDDRQWRAEQLNAVMANVASIATAFLNSRKEPDTRRDLNEQMLQALLIQRESRGSENSLKDQIEILALLDSLREAKQDKEPKEDEGGDMMKILGAAAPLLAALRGGGQAAPPPQVEQPQALAAPPGNSQEAPPGGHVPADVAAAVLSDPQAVSDAAMRDPDGVAQSVMQAVKSNPILEAAVIKALDGE